MEAQNERSQACWLLIPAAAAPLVQSVVYWAPNRAFLCTKAVAVGETRLIAPPMASNATPPTPPAAPRTDCRAVPPRSSVAIPALDSGLEKEADLADGGCRFSLPPLAYQGRWQPCRPIVRQPASSSMALR